MDETYDDFSTPFPDDCPDDEMSELDHAIGYAWSLGFEVYFEDEPERETDEK